MRKEFVQEVDRELWIACAEIGYEMIFESLDGPFGYVAVMCSFRGKLEVYFFCVHVFL